jgi:hypothetical protein
VGTGSKAKIETDFRKLDGLSICFAESESRMDEALLLCPWPESLFAFDPMWERLAQQAHLVAIDLPGFGHSERRDALLSPRTMGEFVVRATDAFGLEEPHVVGPDIGTGALLPTSTHPSLAAGGTEASPRWIRPGNPMTAFLRQGAKHGSGSRY